MSLGVAGPAACVLRRGGRASVAVRRITLAGQRAPTRGKRRLNFKVSRSHETPRSIRSTLPWSAVLLNNFISRQRLLADFIGVWIAVGACCPAFPPSRTCRYRTSMAIMAASSGRPSVRPAALSDPTPPSEWTIPPPEPDDRQAWGTQPHAIRDRYMTIIAVPN